MIPLSNTATEIRAENAERGFAIKRLQRMLRAKESKFMHPEDEHRAKSTIKNLQRTKTREAARAARIEKRDAMK